MLLYLLGVGVFPRQLVGTADNRALLLFVLSKESRRVFEQTVGRLRAELAGDKEAALSAARRESEEELQVITIEGNIYIPCLPFTRILEKQNKQSSISSTKMQGCILQKKKVCLMI